MDKQYTYGQCINYLNDIEIKHREREFGSPMQMSEWTQVIKLQWNMNASINASIKASVEILMNVIS